MALPAPLLQLKTYADLLAMPDDGNRYELIHGEILMSPAPLTEHQRLLRRLSTAIDVFVARHDLGEVLFAPVDVRLSPYNVVQPDLLFVARAREAIIGSRFVEGAPDLVVEVLSPSSRTHDLVQKAALYAEHGVSEYWIVDAEQQRLTVNVLEAGQYVEAEADAASVGTRVLAGFALESTELFRRPFARLGFGEG